MMSGSGGHGQTMYIDLTLTLPGVGVGTCVKIYGALSLGWDFVHRNFSHTKKIKENKKKKKVKKKIKRIFFSFYFFSVFLSVKNYGALTLNPRLVPRKISHMSVPLPGAMSGSGQCTLSNHVHLPLTLSGEGVWTCANFHGALSLGWDFVHRNFLHTQKTKENKKKINFYWLFTNASNPNCGSTNTAFCRRRYR
jgi:hypothetical protein